MSEEDQSSQSDLASGTASGAARSEVTPTVGRIVHYFTRDDAPPRAAIITHVNSDSHFGSGGYVSLHVLTTDGFTDLGGIAFSPTPAANHWSWPARAAGA